MNANLNFIIRTTKFLTASHVVIAVLRTGFVVVVVVVVVVGYGQLSILQVVRLNSSQMISFLA